MNPIVIIGVTAASTAGHDYLIAVAALAFCLLLYALYKLFFRVDFGVPVRRKLLARKLIVVRDQLAFVPFWWSNVQVQRAISSYWKEKLRYGSSDHHPATPEPTAGPAPGQEPDTTARDG